ncbi:hypothetical protein JCM11957_06070 [Caminibacter profundus]
MDKPISFGFIALTVVVLIGGSFLIYLWLKSLKLDTKIDSDKKDNNDNIKRST